MNSYSASVHNAYRERNSLIILALTGRTGSGCTTLSQILRNDQFEKLNLRDPKSRDFKSRDERKYEVVYKYIKEDDRWQPFSIIEGSSVIFSFIIEAGFENFKAFIEQYKSVNETNDIRISAFAELLKSIEGLKYIFENIDYFNFDKIIDDPKKIEEYYDFYVDKLPKLKQDFYDAIKEFTCHREFVDKFSITQFVKSHLYTFFMQTVGNNIRSSGNPYSSDYTEQNFYNVAERINNIINVIKIYNKNHHIAETRICIDAIRNPYEAYFFKDRYSSFYLVSISAEENDRKKRLGSFDEDELKSLDEIEYEQVDDNDYSIFYHQDMQECLAVSDIHIYNPQCKDNKYYFLTEQIVKYICLMIHPGLICPTHIERCMQSAYVARLNSGCLSRQVGAIITGDDYSIKAMGWNEVPEGQVPCNLRCVNDYCANKDCETYSSYELENEKFQNALFNINATLQNVNPHGMSYAYCFKDIYNGLTNTKNQVYTRALHAEENAFLQISKNGGQGIKGGKLFTTASPCELCAKKAFQLGIKDIYYIDPYPGISVPHILSFGKNFSPQMHLFYGAIGNAYMKLYTPRIPVKDELKLLTGVNCKEIVTKSELDNLKTLGVTDIKYCEQSCTFTFKSRSDISETTKTIIEALHDNISIIPQKAYWTGSSFNGFTLIFCDKANTFEDLKLKQSPYCSMLRLKTPLMSGDKVSTEVRIDAKDSKRIMSPYYAQLLSIRADLLTIAVRAPQGLIENVKYVSYADLNMSKDLQTEQILLAATADGDFDVFSYTIDKPNLMYSYCIEWTFTD